KIEIINNNYIPEYLFFTLKKYKNDIQRQTTGTAIPHTNKNIVLNLEIPKINMNDQLWFKSILYKILQNNEENRNLSQLRDTLLPKLMNGEIDLSKVEL
ncbi:MAG: restriction endonuclease subunit S, partial [Bacteroidetes bacterium]|nr:restriction endonuclease subunit S [Bacteroidota bacterium]